MRIEIYKGFYAEIEFNQITKKVNVPIRDGQKTHWRQEDYFSHYESYFREFGYKDKIILKETLDKNKGQIFEFSEVLNCFVSNLLDINETYKIYYEDEITCEFKISQNKTLLISVTGSDTIEFRKYDCKVLLSKLNKIYNSCLFFK